MNQDLLQSLLNYFNITEEEYRSLIAPVNEDNLMCDQTFKHMYEAVSLVKDVVSNNGRIVVYGDYDADGIMGTSILIKMFKMTGFDASYYVPSRYLDGYGLTLSKAQEFIDNEYDLVICVDNGVSAFESIELLKKNNIKVLVLDHHQPQDTLPDADYILHPLLSDFSDVSSSGAFVAFAFSIAYLGRFDKYLSTLAAISTVSDMMPLKKANRNLLRLVFEQYKNGEFLAIDLLKENDAFDENSIAMKIAPKINSIGRLVETTKINNIVKYFVSEDRDLILNYYDAINNLNESRKAISKESQNNIPQDLKGKPAIVYVSDIKEGLIGLVANQLCSTYHVPSIVFTKDSEGSIYKGSCRAPEGFNVVDAFKSLSDILLNSGGHALAGGCSISIDNIELFKSRFVQYAIENPIAVVENKDILLRITDINMENYNLVRSFSPFGESWRSPLFRLERMPVKSLTFSKNNEHITTQVGFTTRLTGFNFPKSSLEDFDYVDMIGSLRTNTFRGFTSVEFLIKKLKESAK